MKSSKLGIAMFLLLGMVGCSNLTPNQNYSLDYATYVGADVGLTAAVDAGKIPPTAIPQIQSDLAIAATDLAAGKVWITANPNLANTIGVYPPEFTLMHSAVQILVHYLVQYGPIAPIPQLSSKLPVKQVK